MRLRRAGPLFLLLALAGCNAPGGARPTIDLSEVSPAPVTYTYEDLFHIGLLLNDEQKVRYAAGTPEERAELVRLLWAELDPTPTTLVNERQIEHYRRLAYVREHFAVDHDPGWDRRGELLLRYGAPDRRQESSADVVESEGLVPPKETWIYAALGQAYELVDPRFQGDFVDSYDVGVTGDATPRSPLAFRAQEVARASATSTAPRITSGNAVDPEAAIAAQKMSAMLERGQEAYREKPQSYRHDYGGRELEFVFDVVNFASERPGRTRVEINTGLWAADLKYREDAPGYEAVIYTEVAVRTMDYRDLAQGGAVTRDRKESLGELKGRLVIGQTRLDLEPGHYRLALSVRDSLSGNIGIYKTEARVRAFPERELRISDIQRVLDVRTGRPGDDFRHGRYQVVPYPMGTFPRERDIYLFFEIYGLEASPTGDVFYGVDVLVKQQTGEAPSWFGSSKGRVVPGITSTFEGTGKAGTVQEYIIFDPSTFRDDLYEVELTVHDRVNDAKTTGSITFGVQKR